MWSLGCLLFEMTNGSPLFPAQDEKELLELYQAKLGEIPDQLIAKGKNRDKFFHYNELSGKYTTVYTRNVTFGGQISQKRT